MKPKISPLPINRKPSSSENINCASLIHFVAAAHCNRPLNIINVPSVAIKDGIPITADKNPFINPTINPKKIQMKINKIQLISKDLKPKIIIIALTAIIAPTEISNLPRINTKVTAIHMIPSSAPSLASVSKLKLVEKNGV